MKPSEIQALLSQAQQSYITSPAGVHTFALYWITWEAYRTRLLAVAIRLCGWRIEDAYQAIGCKKISTQKTYRKCFKDVVGVHLAEQRGDVASVFNQFDNLEALRHRLIHGYRTADPAVIQAANQFIDAVLTQQEKVFSRLSIPLNNGSQVQLGNVLAQRPASGRAIAIQHDLATLKQRFEVAATAQSGRSLDRSIIPTLERLTRKLKPQDDRSAEESGKAL